MAASSTRNRIYGAALAVMAVGFASAPLLLKARNEGKNLTTQAAPLTGSQIMRGAYANTGSRDAGPDPDWDPATGSYKGKSGFAPSSADIALARAALEAKRRRMAGEGAAAAAAEPASPAGPAPSSSQ